MYDLLWEDDRSVVLVTVLVCGMALQSAEEEFRADREIVLTAVRQNGNALEYAAEELQNDREIVLSAVQNTGFALGAASMELRADRAIALAAVQETPRALIYVSDELLLDSTFAPEAKREWYILHVRVLSGRDVVWLAIADDVEQTVVEFCCETLGLASTRGHLVYGDKNVGMVARVKHWPGIREPGELPPTATVQQLRSSEQLSLFMTTTDRHDCYSRSSGRRRVHPTLRRKVLYSNCQLPTATVQQLSSSEQPNL
eukprot:6472322-Amphidinium_carterae.1